MNKVVIIFIATLYLLICILMYATVKQNQKNNKEFINDILMYDSLVKDNYKKGLLIDNFMRNNPKWEIEEAVRIINKENL